MASATVKWPNSQPLSPRLVEIYGDNMGLSRERAGEVAEYMQTALALPAEGVPAARLFALLGGGRAAIDDVEVSGQ